MRPGPEHLQSDLSEALGAVAPSGTRAAGGPGERAALAWVAQRMSQGGRRVVVEGFVEVTSPAATAVLHLGLGLATAAVGLVLPGVAGLLGLGVFASAVAQVRGRHAWLRRLVPRGISYNVLTRVPAAGRRRATVLVVAHVDLPRRGPRLTQRRLLLPLVAGLALVLGQALDAVTLFPAVASALQLASVAVLGASLGVALFRHRVGPRADASTADAPLAALLASLERVAQRPLAGLECVFVATGCGEAHSGGVRALLEQHRHEWTPEDTLVVALTGLTGTRLAWGVSEGVLDRVAYRPTLPGVAERVARRAVFRDTQEVHVPTATGALLPTRLGHRAMSLTSDRPAPAGRRTRGPPPADLTEAAAAFLEAVLGELDADLGSVAAPRSAW